MSEVEGTDGRLLADRYRLGAVLGKGGMGTVWRAVDETLGRTVAVKELRFPGDVDEDEKRRLVTRTLREAKATARIRNSGAITVFDVVKEDNRPWIVMELVEGRSLSDAIREDGPLTPKRAAEVGLVLLDVLKAAHAEGILHRDVKPSNVLIADGGGRVVLGDFGIAQIDGDPSVTSTGMLVGAPSYISPERARGQKPGPPADLWSLGALLYASVEGHPPYDKGSAIATLTAVMTEPVGTMHNAGPLAEAIRGLLIKDPERRLTEPLARALLTAVAQAPDRPVAPPAPVGDAHTVVLPVDPQPTPTDAPVETRRAAADQARMRHALRSVRKAATKPRPAPPSNRPGASSNMPAPPARAPLTDVVPRRTLVIVAAALVIAVLGTVIGIVIANSHGGGGHDTKNGDAKPGATSSASHTAGAIGTDNHHPASASSSGSGSGPSSSAAATPTTPVASDPSTSAGDGATDGADGAGGTADAAKGDAPRFVGTQKYSLVLPKGWKYTGTGAAGDRFEGPDRQTLLIGWTSTPKKDPVADWENQEKGMDRQDYQRVSIAAASYRGWNTADWEFTYRDSGRMFHSVDRGTVVRPNLAYGIMFTALDADWGTGEAKTALDQIFGSFTAAP